MILPNIISEEQGGFVEGKLIYENILLEQEMIQSLSAQSEAEGGLNVRKLQNTQDALTRKYGRDLEQLSPCGVGLSMLNIGEGRIFILCKLEPMTRANGKGCYTEEILQRSSFVGA
ncbi:hypothetical protein LIER_25105 [Lithospermum erythrorhizon]|uniref:Uncharacterized protein n=1 Tax=Lithospermum erythrorhizon TaxID=34254 RepID=A0AAV3Q135_LITER